MKSEDDEEDSRSIFMDEEEIKNLNEMIFPDFLKSKEQDLSTSFVLSKYGNLIGD